jgi:HTH-type transcriptional regulator/antitoxin HigA
VGGFGLRQLSTRVIERCPVWHFTMEDYEQKRYSMGEASPLDSLKELMCAREMQAKDLWPVFGSKGITSEVPNGKRGIGNEMARKLGEIFRVSPAVFN